jgi:outer membrane receptor protein involved in Fe transport
LGADYEIMQGTNLRADWNYASGLFADFDPNTRSNPEVTQAWQAPEYGLFDLGLTHDFEFGDFDATLIANLNNVFDTEYISYARDNGVFYGFGRTFNVGAKFNF